MLSSLLFVSRAKIDIGCGLAGKYRCSGISLCRKSARDLKSDPLCMLLISNSSITDKYKRNIHKMLQFSTWKCILQSWITDKVSTIPQRHEVTLKHASLCYLTCMLHSEDDLFHRKWINDVTPQSLSCIDINRSVSRDNSFSFFFLLLFVMRSWKSMNVFSWKTQMSAGHRRPFKCRNKDQPCGGAVEQGTNKWICISYHSWQNCSTDECCTWGTWLVKWEVCCGHLSCMLRLVQTRFTGVQWVTVG